MLQCFAAGNLGRDAELKDVGGTPLASFSVAVTQRVKKEKVTTWIGCSIFGTRATALVAYLKKGTRVAVTGELTTRQGKDGKTYLDCRVSEVTLMGGGERSAPPEPRPGPANNGGGYPDSDYAPPAGGDDEIPFVLNVTNEPAERWWRS